MSNKLSKEEQKAYKGRWLATFAIAAVLIIALIAWGLFGPDNTQDEPRWEDAADTLAISLEEAYGVESAAHAVLASAEGLDVNEEAVREAEAATTALGDAISRTLSQFEGVFVIHEAMQGGPAPQSGEASVTDVESAPPVAVRVDPDATQNHTDASATDMLAASADLDTASDKATSATAGLQGEVERVRLEGPGSE